MLNQLRALMMTKVSQDNPNRHNLSGLYAITPAERNDYDFFRYAAGVLSGGARLLQYRDKDVNSSNRLARAQALLRLCKSYRARLIINDDVELAKASHADGVHLGRNDSDLHHARLSLGSWAIIGASCYDDLDRARRAAAQGATYLAFGSMFPSATKPNAVRCALPTLTAARQFDLPVVAIGGITLESAPLLLRAGADMLAVIGDLANAENPEQQAQHYCRLWD